MRTLNLANVQDILVGAAFLGTGGGGSLDKGLEMVAADLKAGRSIRLADPDELPQETWMCTPYYCGSLAPTGKTIFEAKEEALYDGQECLLATRALERHLGVAFGSIVATELGGGNTAAALSVAAQLGLPVLDADAAGRSVPDLQHSTYFVAGIPIAPMGIANRYGDEVIVQRVMDDFHAEAFVRSMAVISGGHVGVADHPGCVGNLRKGLVLRSITFCERVGQAIRGKANVIEAILEATGGYLLFRGVAVANCKYEDKEGFTFGEISLRSVDKDYGKRYRIWFKNENIIAWRDDKVDVTVPDLICLLDVEERVPVLNPWVRKGQSIAVFGLPAPNIWRTPKGIEVFGPRYFGFRSKFVPVEKKHRKEAR